MLTTRNTVLFVSLFSVACVSPTAEVVAEFESATPTEAADCGCRFGVPVGHTIVEDDVVWSPRILVDTSQMGSKVTLKDLKIDGEPAPEWQRDLRYYRTLDQIYAEYIFFAIMVPAFNPGLHSLEATLEAESGKECIVRTDFTVEHE